MKKPIQKKDMIKWEKSKRDTMAFESVITDRIDYILEYIVKSFGGKLNYWYFYQAPEGSIGDLANGLESNKVNVNWSCKFPARVTDIVAIIDDYEWDFDGGVFPLSWLFEPFEEKLLNGIKEYKEFLVEQKQAAKNAQKVINNTKKITSKKLINLAKKQMSQEELVEFKKVLDIYQESIE